MTVMKDRKWFTVFILWGKYLNYVFLSKKRNFNCKEQKKFFFSKIKKFKGIVSRDFEWLQTILMNRLCVPDVPLKVYSFLMSHLHTVF